ncbi:MAG: EAL and HDOD domain-containing protein [Brevinema sp.]
MKLVLGRQAILDREQKTIAYELLFRNVENTAIISDTDATAQVLFNTLNMFGSGNVLGSKKGFVNLGIDILRQDILDILPPNKFVLEILETQTPNEELIRRIKLLKGKGYTFALDDFILTKEEYDRWEPVIREVQIVKVDVLETPLKDLENHIDLLRKHKVHLLAEKVETPEMFRFCLSLGFHFFQGYFFTKPVVIEGEGFDPNTQGIMKVIKQVQQDQDIDEIEETIKMYPDLSISVLKLANSASIAPINTITSIKQTLALIGKRSIGQWLMLMLYAQNAPSDIGASSNPLFLLAAQRGKMMEQIIRASGSAGKSLTDESFLAGLLSLSDTLLHVPLEKILDELSVSKLIKDAVLNGEGAIGTALKMVIALETHDPDALERLMGSVSAEEANKIALDAFKFSQDFARAL